MTLAVVFHMSTLKVQFLLYSLLLQNYSIPLDDSPLAMVASRMNAWTIP
jgi:hypothetical protein